MPALQSRATSRRVPLRLLIAMTALALLVPLPVAGATGSYTNPILPEIPGDGVVESCADPTVIQGQEGETDPETGELLWFMYCTTDPLNDEDQDAEGNYIFHFIPMFSSTDLVNWTYEGDAFEERPAWVGDDAGIWAPEITYFNGQYYLYYGASWTDANGSAIGVATSDSPLGPWEDSGDPVVDPICHEPPDNCEWVFDPEVNVDENGDRWIFFGSYYGGIRARELTDDGLESVPATQVQITIPNRYEGAEVVFHDGYYYLFVSAANCCNGPLTGYSVFVGRSESLLGPYVDQTGVSLLDPNVGGTPVLYQNGNQYIGVGHNTVFQDESGQWWTIYHAVDVRDPYFADAVGFTKRPAMLDAIDWVDGWPVLNGGSGPSAGGHKAPAAQPGDKSNYKLRLAGEFELGDLLVEYSDEFDDTTLSDQWSWIRDPNGTEADGVLTMDVQAADLYIDSNNASVLVQDAPSGDWVVETAVRLNFDDVCCFNYAQVGVVLYDDDDNFIKAVEFANWETRQVEFAKEVGPVPEGYARYGNLVAGPTAGGDDWTYIRIVKTTGGGGSVGGVYGGPERYTIYTSLDGETWVRGGTWAGHLGPDLQIGLVAMAAPAGTDLTASVDYVRVYEISR